MLITSKSSHTYSLSSSCRLFSLSSQFHPTMRQEETCLQSSNPSISCQSSSYLGLPSLPFSLSSTGVAFLNLFRVTRPAYTWFTRHWCYSCPTALQRILGHWPLTGTSLKSALLICFHLSSLWRRGRKERRKKEKLSIDLYLSLTTAPSLSHFSQNVWN